MQKLFFKVHLALLRFMLVAVRVAAKQFIGSVGGVLVSTPSFPWCSFKDDLSDWAGLREQRQFNG